MMSMEVHGIQNTPEPLALGNKCTTKDILSI